DEGTATEPLILDEDDVNALIAEGDSKNPFRDSLRVEMEGDTIKSQLSLPMDDFPLPGFKGRYLNGTAELRATLKDGDLEVRVESLTVKGEPLPPQLMDELRKENLAAEMMNDPEARKSLSNLESIEIRDGKLI